MSTRRERNIEFTNKECLCCIWRPLPVCDVVLGVHVEAESLCALRCESVWAHSTLRGPPTLLNFSNPPSVSLIVAIQSCAFLYLCRRDSLKGESHGSSLITPEAVSCAGLGGVVNLPVPSFGNSSIALVVAVLADSCLTFAISASVFRRYSSDCVLQIGERLARSVDAAPGKRGGAGAILRTWVVGSRRTERYFVVGVGRGEEKCCEERQRDLPLRS